MARIENGRRTHHHDGELVVFLIGMRINRPWRPDLWLPAFLGMPRMLAELSGEPDSGFIGYRLTFGSSGPLVVQYWSSRAKLYAYASQKDSQHRPAWVAFNRRARLAPGAVGIWHETYVVEAAESMYTGMPIAGLAKATSSIAVSHGSDRAADRLQHGRTGLERSSLSTAAAKHHR